MTWKPTNAQQLLINAFLSMMLAALAAAGTAFVTTLQTGNVNFLGCLSAALVAFWASFAPALYAYVPSHVVQELQALQDTQAQLQESHNAALLALNNAFSTIGMIKATTPTTPVQSAPASPLVVIHAQNATPTSATPTQESVRTAPLTPTPTPTYLANNATGSTVIATSDLLGDLPQTSGQAVTPAQITGVVPTYGASGQ